MNETLLMIPGTLCDESLFKHQIASLKMLVQCTVVSNSSSDNLQEVAHHILSQTRGNFSVMGLSYGGIIAFELWRQAPERINQLILMNTNHKKPSEKTRMAQQRFIGMSYLGEFREITTHFLKDTLLHPDHAKELEMRETVLNMALNVGRDAFFNQVKAQLARPDSTKDLPYITCPTLIITGRQDVVCPIEQHEEMAALIPHATLEIIDDCGHLSTLEQPDKVNDIVKKFMKL